MYDCPHCGESGVTMLRKLTLNPLVSTTCWECERAVGLHVGKAFAAVLPLPAAFVIFGLLHHLLAVPGGAFLGVAGFGWIVSALLYLKWVPLVRRE